MAPRGIGERLQTPPELDPPGFPKGLKFSNYAKEVVARVPRLLVMIFLLLAVLFLIAIPLGPSFFIMTAMFQLIMLPFFMFFFILPLMLIITYFMFMRQGVFREHNKVFVEGSDIVIEHTEVFGAPFLRNRVPLSNISSVDPPGPDYWKSRKGEASFWQRIMYPLHLPPDGGLYHSHSDQNDLLVITLISPLRIDTPYRKPRFFNFIWSEKVVVNEIIIDVGSEHRDLFLRELSLRGISVSDRVSYIKKKRVKVFQFLVGAGISR